MSMGVKSDKMSARVLKAMSVFSGVRVVGIVCSIVRTKLISLWIGPAGVGLFAIFNSVLEMLSTTTQCNIRDSAVRDISAASAADVPCMAGAVRWWSMRLGLVGVLAIIILSPLLSTFTFGDSGRWWAFALLSVAVFASAVIAGEQAVMQGAGRLRALAASAVRGALIGTVCSVPLFYFLGEKGIIPAIIVFWVSTLLATVMSSDVRSAPSAFSEKMAAGRRFLTLGMYLTVSSLVTTGVSYIFLSYLNREGSETVAGIYQSGYTLVINYIGIVFAALSMEFYPRVVKVCDRRRMASVVVSHEMVLLLYLLTPMLVLLISVDRPIMQLLYSDEFLAALPFVTVGAVSAVFRAVSFCMAFVILARGDGRIYVVTETLSAVVGLVLNIVFYNNWSFAGIGFSYVLWYFVYTLIVATVYRRRYDMRLSRGALWLGVVALACVSAAAALKYYVDWWAPLALLPFLLYFCGGKLLAMVRTNKKLQHA